MERIKTVKQIVPNKAITFHTETLPINNLVYDSVNTVHYNGRVYKIGSDHYIMNNTLRIIDAIRIDYTRKIAHVMELQQGCFNDDWLVILSKYKLD